MQCLKLSGRIDAKFLSEQPPAPLVRKQAGRPVARPRVCADQVPVGALTERVGGDSRLGRHRGVHRVAHRQSCLGENIERTEVKERELPALRVDPGAIGPGQQRPGEDTAGPRRGRGSLDARAPAQGRLAVLDLPRRDLEVDLDPRESSQTVAPRLGSKQFLAPEAGRDQVLANTTHDPPKCRFPR
jgi:hypothetical protein